jgi:hypothetical protein
MTEQSVEVEGLLFMASSIPASEPLSMDINPHGVQRNVIVDLDNLGIEEFRHIKVLTIYRNQAGLVLAFPPFRTSVGG